LKLALLTNITFQIVQTNHKFLDLFKTTINFSPTNKNKTTTIKAQQIGIYDQFITINNPKQSKRE